MTRDLKLGVEITGAQAAERDLNRVGRAADHMGDEFTQAGNKARIAAHNAQQLERLRLETAQRQAHQLARALDDVGDEARRAAREVDRIGGPSLRGGGSGKTVMTGGFMGLFGDIAHVGAKAGAETATTFAAALQGGIMSAFKNLPAPAQAAIVAGVAGSISIGAPIIASAFSAALLLGVGGAGLAGGIALAVQSDPVKRAFGGLGETVLTNLRDAARPFQGELVESANIFGKVFKDSLPDIRGVFSTLSTAVRPLAGGLALLVRNALPGIRRAAEAAVPLFRELARQAPEIGAALSEFFDSIAASGPGAVATFRQLLDLTKGLIVATGGWLEQLGYVAQGASIVQSILLPFGKHASTLSGPLTDGFEDVGKAAGDAGREVHNFKVKLDEVFGRQLDAREAAIAYEQALDDLATGFKKGSDALDINNQKGRDNITLIDNAISRARDKLKADMDAAGGSQTAIDAANRAYQSEIERIKDVLRHLGYNEAKINDLIGKADAIPRDITIDVGLVGANAAAGMLNQLGGAIGRLLGGVRVSASKEMKRRARGGPVVAGEAYIVGEHRPEIFVPKVNGTILPDASGMSRSGAGVASPARSGAPVLHYAGTPMGLDAMFLSWLEKKLRNGDLQLAR